MRTPGFGHRVHCLHIRPFGQTKQPLHGFLQSHIMRWPDIFAIKRKHEEDFRRPAPYALHLGQHGDGGVIFQFRQDGKVKRTRLHGASHIAQINGFWPAETACPQARLAEFQQAFRAERPIGAPLHGCFQPAPDRIRRRHRYLLFNHDTAKIGEIRRTAAV